MNNKINFKISNGAKKILIIAGEASSDMHAANLVNEIRTLNSDISFFGLGGKQMQRAGVELRQNIVHLAFIGPGGLFKHYFTLRKILLSLCNYLEKNPPDCAILIDYAEFNLRVAQKLKSLGVPVIYYISPQVWAWGSWRIKTIKKLVDKMLVFFKFEEALYKAHGVDALFIGHPLLDMVNTSSGKEKIKDELGLAQDSKVIGIVPGSRINEIINILPVMIETCKFISQKYKDKRIEFVLACAPTIEESLIKKIIGGNTLNIKIVRHRTHDCISVCDCALVTSGTATLETALLGVPMAILYKTNFLTYIFTKNLIQLPYIGLVNIIYGEKIAPEFLQYEANPGNISDYIVRLLKDEKLSCAIKEKYTLVRKALGEKGAVRRAASCVVNFISERQAAGI